MTASFPESGRNGNLPSFTIAPLNDREFRAFRKMIEDGLGIRVTEQKRDLVAARLARRLRILNLHTYGQYLEFLSRHPEEIQELYNRISTNETAFLREPAQFAFIENEIVPALKREADATHRPKKLRIWSAGCSTGEEPYSIAMSCLSTLPGWKIEILATDISTRALDHARTGVWPLEAEEEIPTQFRERFIQRGVRSQSGRIRIGTELKAVIRFERLNLNSESPLDQAPFDLIFCRNVLIYFDGESRRRALERLFSRLAPQGFVFLGHSESLIGYYDRFRSVAPSIYQARANVEAAR